MIDKAKGRSSKSSRGSAKEPLSTLPKDRLPSFVALDFETANRFRKSACAIGIVRVENGEVSRFLTKLIRPPEMFFEFSYIHGIHASDVEDAPTFQEIFPEILEHIHGVDFIAAHNASFDRSVMKAACAHWDLVPPDVPWECTVKLARARWNLFPTKLPNVCAHLGLSLERHHDAASDAMACAQIVMAATRGSRNS